MFSVAMNQDMEGEHGSCSSGMTGLNQVTDPVMHGEHGSCSSGMDGNKGSGGLHAIANFYDNLCPAWEEAVPDAHGATVPRIPHDNIMESVQRAMQSAVYAMGGCLNCQELEAMGLSCVEGGNILSVIQVATFHAYWHRFMAWTETDPPRLAVEQAVAIDECGQMALVRSMDGAMQLQREGGPLTTGFCMSHICSVWGWIGFEETYGGTNNERDVVWMKGALHASNQLARIRSELCFSLRYALGEFLYTTAFHNCNRDEGKQTILFKMALPELMAYGRDVAEESESVLDVFTVFSRAGKVAIKLQKSFNEVMDIYKAAAVYAGKLGQEEWERLLFLLCSGLQELENDGTVAGFKIFVGILNCGVKLADRGGDLLSKWFDLLSHASWWTNKSMCSLKIGHLTTRLLMPTLDEFVRANLGTSKALLGGALFVLGQEVEGLKYLECVHRMLADDKLNPSLHQSQKFLALSYAERHAAQDHRKAAEMFEAASKSAPDLQTQLKMDVAAALEWVKIPEEFARGLERMQGAVHTALQRLPHEWEFRAFLFFEIGGGLLGASNLERGIEHLESGWSLCAANDLALALGEDKMHARDIVKGLARLLCIYVHMEKLSAALSLYNAVDPILADLRSTTDESPLWMDTAWRCWQQALEALNEATGFPADEVPQWEIPVGRYSWNLESMLNEDIGGGATYLFAAADHYEAMVAEKCGEGDWKGAVDTLNILEEKTLQRGVLTTRAKVVLQVNRSWVLWRGREFSHAHVEIQKAVDMVLGAETEPWLLTEIYMTQAYVNWKLENLDAAHASLDMAEKNLSHGKDKYWRKITRLRSLLLQEAGQYEAAAQLSCELAHSYGAAQSKLGLESAWLPFLEGTWMPRAFKVAALQYLLQKDMPKALIWAERGRTRLFMHRVNELEAEKFDESDQYAEDILYKTIELCGPNTVIIECSILDKGMILTALVNHPVVGKRCASKFLDLNKFFKNEANCAGGKNIEEIVVNVRNYIQVGNDDKAMPGLTILHSILVQSILDQYHELRSCTSIIFAPEGFLHLIPFAALYDGFAEKFLIEQKAVGLIPSIRSLHNCFYRQQILENGVQVLDDAFIAGNPEPMGLELPQLPGAAAEAQQVAEILGVEACKGENITKEVVVRALTKNSVVLLATHGLGRSHKNPYLNPYGNIVLKGAYLDSNSEEGEFGDSTTHEQEVLTFDEIATMEGGISAGLVVLSACCPLTSGNVFEEGLLNLGRAVLQGGAASAVVSLWNVDDHTTRILIVDMFKEMKKGIDVLHSVQNAMVKMLRGPKPNKLQHWSALVVLGSPTFQLPGCKHSAEVNLKQHDMIYYRGSQLSADDIGENVMYPRAIVHQFRNMIWQREDEGQWAAAIATVDDLEERLQKNGIVNVVAKSKLHLLRGKYLNQSKGGSWKALNELQKAVDVLPDIKKMPELVAEIYLERAKAFFRMKDLDATSIALEKALDSVVKCQDNILLYNVKVFRRFALNEAADFESAAALAREAQLKEGLGNTSAWVPLVDDAGLKNPFSFYEIESREQGDVNKALTWAERGRTTFPEGDGDDSAAIRSILKTASFCDPNTVIIYLSYHHQNMLLLYGFSSKASVCIRLFLKKVFSNEKNCVMGASLEEVVSRVRQHITKGEDQKAILGLSFLYKLLVHNIVVEFKQVFAGSTELIFAPQGFLCHIPFAALYDSSSNKFLVEQVAVGVIPSICSLGRCFSQQEKFESDFKLKEDSDAFVCGNSEPMSLELEQLPGACQVANAVARILDVEAFRESKITKEALLEALVTRSIVMLATHSIGGHRERPYPYGAMVLKQDTVAALQFLTCEDIAALEGKIKAGLVVLIACQKGDQAGTLSRDGLLGLGHAALEVGAVSTIASLWEVNEDALEPLISAIFVELLRGSDVLHSVQKAMTDVLKSREIRHWASLTVLGSPTLRISTQPQPDTAAPESQNLSKTEPEWFAKDLDTLRKDCLESFAVNTDNGPTTLDKLSQGIAQTVLQQLVERYAGQIQQAEGEGDLTTEIVQCSNLGWVYGAMGEWNTCREWLVRSVSVAREKWEQVKGHGDVVSSLPNSGKFIINVLRLHGSRNLDLDLELAKFGHDAAC